jgi:GGDEF domain-containing protein
MLSGPPRRRRARPVADAPIDSLLARAEDLAKGWLLALLEQAPLDEAPGILAADLSRDGPRVCEAVLRALANDNDLRRLEPGGALIPLASRVGDLAGATGPESTSRAVDALHAVIWAGLRDELRSPEPELVTELAERLALVTEQLRGAALRRGQTAGGDDPSREPSPTMHLAPPPHAPPRVSEPPAPEDRPGAHIEEEPSLPDPVSEPDPGPEPSWPAVGDQAGDAAAQALWIGAFDEEIRRSGAEPLSLLLTELEDADRVEVVETRAEASATFSEFARAVRSVVRRQDILVCETDTRAWIIARDTGRAGAQSLSTRILDAVRVRRPWRGAALTASIGVAVLGEDGRTSTELMDAAEEARFAAAAAGIGVIRAIPDDAPAND